MCLVHQRNEQYSVKTQLKCNYQSYKLHVETVKEVLGAAQKGIFDEDLSVEFFQKVGAV